MSGQEEPAGVSRRRLFGWLGAGTAGVLAAGATGGVIGRTTALDTASASGPRPDDAVPFTGAHQAGIVTPAQDRLHFVALDLTTTDRAAVISLLKRWTTAAERMTAGAEAALEEYTAQLAEEVEAIVEETGYERIHIVAHSLGGVVARYYVTRLGGDERVHTLATLGSPHTGTLAAYLLPTSLTRQLRPGSGLMQELNQPAPGCRTRVIAIWSDTDEAVVPAVNASLRQDGVATTNIRMHGVGHLSLPILPSVARTARLPASRSMRSHDSPNASPLRRPVDAIRTRAGK